MKFFPRVLLFALFLLPLSLQSRSLHADSVFSDVPDNHWAKAAIDRMVKLGIASGFPDGTFRGNSTFNRYETIVFLDNLYKALSDKMETVSAQSAQSALESVGASGDAQLPGSTGLANRKMLYELKDEIDSLRADVRALKYSVQKQQKQEAESFTIRGTLGVGMRAANLLLKSAGNTGALYGVQQASLKITKQLQEKVKLTVGLDRATRRWENNLTLASFDLNAALDADWGMGEFPLNVRWTLGRGQYVDTFTGAVVEAEKPGLGIASEIFGLPINLGYYQKNTSATLGAANSVSDPTDRSIAADAARQLHAGTSIPFPFLFGSWPIALNVGIDYFSGGDLLGTAVTKDSLIYVEGKIAGDGFTLGGKLVTNMRPGGKALIRGDYELFSAFATALHVKTWALGTNGAGTDPATFSSDPDLGQDVNGVDIYDQPIANGDYVYSVLMDMPTSKDKRWNVVMGASFIGQTPSEFMQRIKFKTQLGYQMADHVQWTLQYRLDNTSASYSTGVANITDGVRFGFDYDF